MDLRDFVSRVKLFAFPCDGGEVSRKVDAPPSPVKRQFRSKSRDGDTRERQNV